MLVCFIGHRNTPETEDLKQAITDTVVGLIEMGTDTFIFGSRSNFNDLCWEVVTELQKAFPHLKRISYRVSHEAPITSKEEKSRLEKAATVVLKQEIHLMDYECAVSPADVEDAGKLSYIKRNQLMIDASDVCVFYYNSEYQLVPKPVKNKMLPPPKPPKSGTKQAFEYAKSKHKQIINLYN